MRRVGWWAFPVYELRSGGEVLARLGPSGWLRIYFGTGQKVVFADGDRWLIRSTGIAGAVWAVIVDDAGRKVAMAGAKDGTYGINTHHQGYTFYPSDPPRTGRRVWTLRSFEEDIATVHRRPLRIEAHRPVPLGVAVLGLVIARYGIPQSGLSLPSFRWR